MAHGWCGRVLGHAPRRFFGSDLWGDRRVVPRSDKSHKRQRVVSAMRRNHRVTDLGAALVAFFGAFGLLRFMPAMVAPSWQVRIVEVFDCGRDARIELLVLLDGVFQGLRLVLRAERLR